MKSLFKNQNVGSIITVIVAIAGFHAISAFTGLGAWVHATPIAETVIRVLVILLTGASGLALLIWPPRDDADARPLFCRLVGAFLLVIALANATILLGDPLHIRPE